MGRDGFVVNEHWDSQLEHVCRAKERATQKLQDKMHEAMERVRPQNPFVENYRIYVFLNAFSFQFFLICNYSLTPCPDPEAPALNMFTKSAFVAQ
jgi:hypothetical protein